MAWNALNIKDNGHSVGLAYLSDINTTNYEAGSGILIEGNIISTNLSAGANITLVPGEGNSITINAVGGSGGGITEVVAGLGIGVSDADPERPIVYNTGVVSVSTTNGSGILLGERTVDGDIPITSNLIQGDGILLTPAVDNTGITISAVPVETGVSSLSDGTTALTGAITLIGQGCDIGATSDPSPAITISIPVQEGVKSLNKLLNDISLTSTDNSITIAPNILANTIDLSTATSVAGVASLNTLTGAVNITCPDGTILVSTDGQDVVLKAPPVVAGVLSVSDGTNVASGAVKILAGEGIETTYDAGSNAFTLSSDPFVGIYNLLTAQDLTATGTPWINQVINMTPDPETDVAIMDYNAGTGTWTVKKDGVYFLNFSAGIIQNDAKWTFGSFCQCFIVVILGGSAPQYNMCNNLTPNDNSGVGTFNGQVFGYIPLTVGTTITCGFQWYLQTVGSPVAQFQPRTSTINNGTNFNWVYVRPLL